MPKDDTNPVDPVPAEEAAEEAVAEEAATALPADGDGGDQAVPSDEKTASGADEAVSASPVEAEAKTPSEAAETPTDADAKPAGADEEEKTPAAAEDAKEPAAGAEKAKDTAATAGAKPAAKRAAKKKVESVPAVALSEEEHLVSRNVKRSAASFLFSTTIHVVIIVLLGLWALPETATTFIPPLVVRSDEEVQDLETEELDEQLEAATEMIFGPSSAPTVAAAAVSDTKIEQVTQTDAVAGLPINDVDISSLLASVAGDHGLIQEVPTGTHGQARSVVDNYSQAMDRITQALLQMLYKDDVLVIWLFDQSESMKDDQKQIRDRIERVYQELGLSDRAKGEHLLTSVVSFGADFMIHTPKATADMQKIREAIDAVPNDKTGKEITCQAIGRAISHFRKFAVQGKRRLAMVLVTDESGEQTDNVQFLEAAIKEAQSAQCRVYILGREAVFGYPYAYIRWRHPQTNRPHWLRIDRGPETAFVEQIQTDGFHRRWDAFPSGYGPYEQSRLAMETGGAFFLLPSVEPNLVRGEKRRYELDAMR
ncbi:MAG: VWA domain-containing protein, partial [Rhodopirellula sp.]|nr:VWA domain-containing protein [Rhodopirellula sp.]